jgi:hypothetical protein
MPGGSEEFPNDIFYGAKKPASKITLKDHNAIVAGDLPGGLLGFTARRKSNSCLDPANSLSADSDSCRIAKPAKAFMTKR